MNGHKHLGTKNKESDRNEVIAPPLCQEQSDSALFLVF